MAPFTAFEAIGFLFVVLATGLTIAAALIFGTLGVMLTYRWARLGRQIESETLELQRMARGEGARR